MTGEKWSRLSLVSFTLIALCLIYSVLISIINLFTPPTVIVKTVFFSALFSFILYVILFILNLIAFIICVKARLKGKWISITGMIFSLVLIGYIIVAALSGPR